METAAETAPTPSGPARGLWRLAAFLGAVAIGTAVMVLFVPSFGGTPPQAASPAKSEGERLYRMHCGTCHGAAGEGRPAEGKPELRGRFLSVEVIERSMREGGKNMPKFGDLPADQMEKIADFVHGM